MYRALLIFCLFLSFLRQTHARIRPVYQEPVQPISSIRGKVIDEQARALPFAVVRLESPGTNVPISTFQTDTTGKFEFAQLQSGSYVVRVDYLGYTPAVTSILQVTGEQPIPDLIVRLQPAAQALQEVKIVASKPLIERQLDKTVINVEGNAVAAGNSALDVLTLSPGVILNNGRLLLNGKAGVLVLIDNKQTYLSQEQLNTYLRSINASELKQIELITNPSAKYDAQGTGGIINIVLKNTTRTGSQLTLLSGVGYGYYPRYNTGINFNHRHNKWSVFGSYTFSRSNRYERVRGYRQLLAEGLTLEQRNDIKITGTSNLVRAGAEYQASEAHTLGFQARTTLYREHIPQDNTTRKINDNAGSQADSTFTTGIDSHNRLRNYSFNLYHTLKLDSGNRQLATSFDHARFFITSRSTYSTLVSSPENAPGRLYSSLLSDLPYQTSIFTAKTDYTQTLQAKYRLESGAKMSYVHTTNTLQYFNTLGPIPELDQRLSSAFDYQEQIYAGYFSLKHESQRVNLQFGLRGEQTRTQGASKTVGSAVNRHYFNLFPSLFASYTPSQAHQWSLTYSRRIERPLYRDLNPFIYYVDPFSSLQGNPLLRPQFTHAGEAMYLLKQKYSLTASYSHTTDVIVQIPEQVEGTNAYVLRKSNISTQRTYGLLLNCPVTVAKVLTSNFSFNLYNSRFSSVVPGEALNNRRVTFEFNFSNQLNLPKEFIAEVSGYYISPFVQGYYRTAGITTINTGLKRSFYAKRLDVKLNVNDIFKSYQAKNTAAFDNQVLSLRQTFNTRFINLSVAYRVSKGEKLAPVRRNESSQEEQKRVK